jgi:Xaa-Pro aminopeptidase
MIPMNFDLTAIQTVLGEFHFDGWLLYDFRGSNLLALRVLGIEPNAVGSRRLMYFIPREGPPIKLVHRIESAALDHLPGKKIIYLRWQEFEAGIAEMLGDHKRIAMEYSPRNGNPYISRVDAGTIEIVKDLQKEIGASGDLISYFESRWTEEQWQSHLEADSLNREAFELAWQFITDRIRGQQKKLRETDVQSLMMDFFDAHHMTTYHPPIIGVNSNSGDPHYSPQVGNDSEIKEGDFVLIDSWAKMKTPKAVYSDLTKVGFLGTEVPQRYTEIFQIVAQARDAGIAFAREALQRGDELFGWQIDDATRNVIEQAGYGKFFVHRTGHNIGQETHGNGAHIDNLETRDERRILTRTCFSIEPGIYLPEFGVRSEIDVYIDEDSNLHVTGGLQQSVIALLSEY